MKTKLIIFKLSIKSSYNQNLEQPADEACDTLQFFIREQTIIRIRTYAIDHDLHIHKVNLRNNSIEETITFLISSTNEHYGAVVDKMVELEIPDMKDPESMKTLLIKQKLSPYLETTADYIFWNPDNKKYHNQSNPM